MGFCPLFNNGKITFVGFENMLFIIYHLRLLWNNGKGQITNSQEQLVVVRCLDTRFERAKKAI